MLDISANIGMSTRKGPQSSTIMYHYMEKDT